MSCNPVAYHNARHRTAPETHQKSVEIKPKGDELERQKTKNNGTPNRRGRPAQARRAQAQHQVGSGAEGPTRAAGVSEAPEGTGSQGVALLVERASRDESGLPAGRHYARRRL